MMGAAINIVPIMIQRNVPGIGPYVIHAYLLAAVPAILAAMAYAILGSAMPRAGGSYIYASRGLNPYLGFIASFSQWFGLSIAIGVVSYVMIPFIRDIVEALGLDEVAQTLDKGVVRVTLSLLFLWIFVFINLRGVQLYERTLIPLMFLMFALGSIVIAGRGVQNQPRLYTLGAITMLFGGFVFSLSSYYPLSLVVLILSTSFLSINISNFSFIYNT